MNEDDWLACDRLTKMQNRLRLPQAPARKRWLLACACCRRIWHLLKDERSRRLIELREGRAIGRVAEEEVLAALDPAAHAREDARDGIPRSPDSHSTSPQFAAVWAATAASANSITAIDFAIRAAGCACAEGWSVGSLREQAAICDLIRDIFGNPFRPVMVDPVWLTDDVRVLSRGIYDDYAFDRLPILADALQDAGCENADILDHCRGLGPHVRGCWVVDLILGKE